MTRQIILVPGIQLRQNNNLTLITDGTPTCIFFIKHIYNEKTVRLFHKADRIDINFAIRSTMTKTTLNKMTITEDEIDNYVDILTNTITSAIAETVPTKSIKRNFQKTYQLKKLLYAYSGVGYAVRIIV